MKQSSADKTDSTPKLDKAEDKKSSKTEKSATKPAKKKQRDVPVHTDHRTRMRERMIRQGFDSLEPHEALEVLLYYVVPRRDVNPLAHRLIRTFGGYHRVFEASMDELKKVDGVGDQVALYLYTLGAHERRCDRSRTIQENSRVQLDTVERMADYLRPQFKGLRQEIAVLLCLDAARHPISCDVLCQGSVSASEVNVQAINELAMRHKADSVVLAHNHPRGPARPSQADIQTTEQLRALLRGVGICLIEHLIFGEHDFVSLSECGFFAEY